MKKLFSNTQEYTKTLPWSKPWILRASFPRISTCYCINQLSHVEVKIRREKRGIHYEEGVVHSWSPRRIQGLCEMRHFLSALSVVWREVDSPLHNSWISDRPFFLMLKRNDSVGGTYTYKVSFNSFWPRWLSRARPTNLWRSEELGRDSRILIFV